MELKISHIKISVKVKNLSLGGLLNNPSLNTENVTIKHYDNFVIIFSRFTYIVFKKSGRNTENHINIAKIENLNQIDSAIQHFTNQIAPCDVISTKVDNISAHTQLKSTICLSKLHQKIQKIYSTKFNQQKFPCLFIRVREIDCFGTILVFASGKVNVVGPKNIEDLNKLLVIINGFG